MVEITFQNGSDIMKVKVGNGSLSFAASATNFEYIEMIDQGLVNERNLSMLRRKKGEKFYADWCKDLRRFNKMTEEEIAEELIRDEEKAGWTLLSKEWV